MRLDALVGGALLIGALLLGVVQWQAASSAFLLIFPLLGASVGWVLQLRQDAPRQAGLLLLSALLLAPAVALLVQPLYFVLLIFGVGPLVLIALLLLGFALPVLLPLLSQRPILPALALMATFLALTVGHFTRWPIADQPQQTQFFYTLAADLGRAYWLSPLLRPDAWTRQVLTRPHYVPLPAVLPGATSAILYQDAPRLALSSPQLLVPTNRILAGRRHLQLLVRPGRTKVRSLRPLLGAGPSLRTLRLAGHLVMLSSSTSPKLSIIVYAPHGW